MMSRMEAIESLKCQQPAGAKMKALSTEELKKTQAGGDVQPETVGQFVATVAATVAISSTIGCGPNG